MVALPRRNRSNHDLKSIAQEMSTSETLVLSLARHLERAVGNAFVLYANYKHYHRQTLGPHFRDLHLVFGEFALEALDSIDDLAKRIHIISDDPPTHLLRSVQLSAVSAAPPHSTIRDMVEEAGRNVHIIVIHLHDAARIAQMQHDRGTIDVVSRQAQVYERHKSWLGDIVNRREGPQLV
jgi:starvation-inducible DNA-binding protein